MGRKYKQLSPDERVSIYHWHASGRSARWIGEALGRHHSTISRELERNGRVTKVWDVVKEGEKLKVKVLEIGRDGKIRLSHKAVLEEEHGRPNR